MRRQITLIVLGSVTFAAVVTAILFANGQKLEREAVSHRQRVNILMPVRDSADSWRHSSEKLPNRVAVSCLLPLHTRVGVNNDDAKVQTSVQVYMARKLAPHTLVQSAKQGDVSAALVLFQKVRPCSKTTRYMDNMEFEVANSDYFSTHECAQLPASLLRNPIDILIPAAEGGSTAAKLLISKNAPTVASIMAILRNGSEQERSSLLATAERHGLDAARSGSESATAWLVHSYLSGTFGRKDASGAYAISEMWARSGSAGDRERAVYVRSQLSMTELRTAKSLLTRCAAESDRSSILLSPFN